MYVFFSSFGPYVLSCRKTNGKIWMNAKHKNKWQASRVKKTDRPRNKIVNEDWWQRLVREMYLHTSHSLFNPPSFASAQSPSITGQLYPPVRVQHWCLFSIHYLALISDATGKWQNWNPGRTFCSIHHGKKIALISVSYDSSKGSIFI